MNKSLTAELLLRLICSIFLSIGLVSNAFGQLDTIHWLSPMHSRDNAQIEDHYLYLSTPSTTPFTVTIKDGAGNLLAAPTISNALPNVYSIGTGQVPATKMMVPIDSLNTVLSASGLIVHGPQEFYANFRAASGVQGASLTAKGRVGLGVSFRVGSMPQQADYVYRNFVASFIASEDNTVVTVSEYDTACVFDGLVPDMSNAVTINLDAGECYVMSGYTTTSANWSGFIGALIESTAPIAVSTGNMCGNIGPATSLQDHGIDQIVPVAEIGMEYILIEGDGTSLMEMPLVVAHYDSTEVYVNGGVAAIDTLNAGEWLLVSNSNFIGTLHRNMYIRTSQPCYMYQPVGGDANEATPGLNFIPPFSCAMPKEVDLIPAIDSIGITTYSGAIIAFTETDSALYVNGLLQTGSEPVTGLPDWETYKITGFSGPVEVTSSGALAVGMFGFSGQAGYAGYFSGFGAAPSSSVSVTNLNAGNIVICETDSMLFESETQGEVFSFLWDLGDGTTSSDTALIHIYDTIGTYDYSLIVEFECITDTIFGSVTIEPLPVFELEDVDLCVAEEVIVGVDHEPGLNYNWSTGDTTSTITINVSTMATLTVDNGVCFTTDSITVTIPGIFRLPNVFTPNGDGNNDVFELAWLNQCETFSLNIYDRWGILVFETDTPHTDFWNGRIDANAAPATAGPYFFILLSENEEYKGVVTLFR